MFGSTRFMAPEEFELGATIDERTTVFTLGRTASVLLSDNSLDRKPFRGSDSQYEIMLQACRKNPDARFQTVSQIPRLMAAIRLNPGALQCLPQFLQGLSII